MTEEQAKKLPKYTKNPIFNGLPDYLKDPANYNKIQKALLDELASPHSHTDVIEWYKCNNSKCSEAISRHGQMMTKLGFNSPAQYYAWKKVMHYIMNPPEKVKLR